MAGKTDSNVQVTLEKVVCDYTSGLFEARTVQGGTNPRYSYSIIVDKNSPSFKIFSAAVEKSVKAVFGDEWQKKLKEWKNNSMRCCFMEGPVKNEDRYPEDTIVISTNRNQSQGRIAVFDRKLNQLTVDDGVVYPGCIVNATFNLWTQNDAGQIGLRAQAVNIQFVRDGEALSGGGVAGSQGLKPIEDSDGEDVADIMG
jgi:hypothetical protein